MLILCILVQCGPLWPSVIPRCSAVPLNTIEKTLLLRKKFGMVKVTCVFLHYFPPCFGGRPRRLGTFLAWEFTFSAWFLAFAAIPLSFQKDLSVFPEMWVPFSQEFSSCP